MGKPVKVHTLALVVPDHRTNMHVPLLIGTNTLDPLYEDCAPTQNERHRSNSGNCSPLIKTLYNRFKMNQQNGRVGTVKLQSKKCVIIPAGERLPRGHDIAKLSFPTAVSCLPAQSNKVARKWKNRITKKLNSRPRPIHPSDYEAVRRHLKELQDVGVIRESESPFASPIVVVKKKNVLTGSKWFSIMDLKSGYYQVDMDEDDKCVTNAPSTFQRVMEKCMGGMNLREVLVFLDDVIVFSETLEEHEDRLLRALQRTSVKYLGHVVSANGVETDPQKIAALTTWPRPNNIKELKSFLGFAGYYRRFIKDYSKIARPLNDLTAGYLPPKRRLVSPHSSSHRPSSADYKKPFNEKWTPVCEDAFKTLIQKLTSAPILAFADMKKPYVVHTDASTHGLGAALYQEQEGKLRWAVTEKFFDYLYGAKFTVITDNNPLTYVLTSAKLDAAGHRWLAALSSFDFNIQYRAGRKNQDADGLSRRPHPHNHCQPDPTADDEENLCQRHQHSSAPDSGSDSIHPPVPIECLAMEVSAIPEEFSQTDIPGSCTLPRMSLEDWAREQRQDPVISRVIDIVKERKRLSYRAKCREDREVQLMLRAMDQFVFSSDVLYRRRVSQGEHSHQLVLPVKYRKAVLENLHDAVGHMGVERTLDLVRARFYWPRMSVDVSEKIRTCERCIRRKAQAERSAPLVNIKTSRPLQLVCMDYLSLEPDGRGTKNILVITDHFTKYAVAVPTADQKAKTVAKALWNNFFNHYGFPERLHSDQGRDFESALIKDLCALLGIKKTRTTPYHPRGNPVERFNRTLLEMLGTLEEGDKVRWKDFVQPLVHAYNCTKNDTTAYSPYQLMFGRQPRLPLDIAFGLTPEGLSKISHTEYIKNLTESLTESYRLATENSLKTALQNKRRFDSKVRESTLLPGDRVLVRNVGIRGKHKIADRWSETIYKVVKQIQDSPVYVVVPEHSNGPERVLHRDLLLPCGFLPSTVNDEQPEKNKSQQKPDNLPAPEPDQPDDEEKESDEDEEVYYTLYDQLLRESNVQAEQERQISQVERHETDQSAKRDTQLRLEPSPEKPDVSLSSEKSVFDPEAPAFEPANNGASLSQNLSESESVTAESVPDVPTTDPGECHSPGSEREDASPRRTSGDVLERMGVDDAEVAPDSEHHQWKKQHVFVSSITSEKQHVFVSGITSGKQHVFVSGITSGKQHVFVSDITSGKQHVFVSGITSGKQHVFVSGITSEKQHVFVSGITSGKQHVFVSGITSGKQHVFVSGITSGKQHVFVSGITSEKQHVFVSGITSGKRHVFVSGITSGKRHVFVSNITSGKQHVFVSGITSKKQHMLVTSLTSINQHMLITGITSKIQHMLVTSSTSKKQPMLYLEPVPFHCHSGNQSVFAPAYSGIGDYL
ncbi:hypothetical protein NFI96_005150 [Prochilodus magdalenae]|nr:hypothetical protein NFI96_005150 [Prochilodus magdalenae]